MIFRLVLAFVCAFGFLQTALAQDSKTDVLDVTHLPLGDGRISDQPRAGYVYSCIQNFHGGPGAQVDGPWIHGDTWNLTEKITVRGEVMWPNAEFAITTGERDRMVVRLINGNGLPVDTPTGSFPIARDDPAYRIDRNPNTIREQEVELVLPRNPEIAPQPSCAPLGMVGVALNGVAILNGLDAAGRDAVAHEVQDLCNGHPQQGGEYHYHGPSPCLPNETENATLIGYAIDGFGIYSIYDEDGREITNADLDECHGRVSDIDWDGERVTMYHYVLTREYPYTIGCFRSTPAEAAHRRGAARHRSSGMPRQNIFHMPLQRA